jgi:hypothetical protein
MIKMGSILVGPQLLWQTTGHGSQELMIIIGSINNQFTHNDLVSPTILLTQGPNPRVAAVIDWAQIGWYPAYWEYCKTRRIRTNPDYFNDEVEEEWNTKYLPRIPDPVDDETFYHPFVWFYLSKGV